MSSLEIPPLAATAGGARLQSCDARKCREQRAFDESAPAHSFPSGRAHAIVDGTTKWLYGKDFSLRLPSRATPNTVITETMAAVAPLVTRASWHPRFIFSR